MGWVKPCAAVFAVAAALAGTAQAEPGSTLGTPQQLAAERQAAQVLASPRVQAAVASVRADLTADPAAARPEGKAALNAAVDSWAASLAFQELGDPLQPAFLLYAEDTPRTWFGQSAPGAAIAGDNPDNIYRQAQLDGAQRYEIRGRVPRNGPTQFSFEVSRVRDTFTVGKGKPDMGNQVAMLADRSVRTDTDGRFTITLDAAPANGRPNHIQLVPGPLKVTFRNTLNDWRQAPVAVELTRVGGAAAPAAASLDDVAAQTAARLPQFVHYWSSFKEGWLGAPAANTLAEPAAREGGWGYLAGGRFDLADDEALVITTTDGGAAYVGVQISDRWFVTPDNRRAFTSLNNTQAVKNADGSTTFVIAPTDPGVANWIGAEGLHHGFVILRWQQTPAAVDASRLLRSAKVAKLAELKTALPAETRWVTPSERAAALSRRAADYELRFQSRE